MPTTTTAAATTTSTTTTSRPTSLTTGHVGINVTDLDRSKHFYATVFGLDVSYEGTEHDRRFAFLSQNGRLLLTLWQQAESPFDSGRSGLHHLSFSVDTVEEVEQAEARLRQLGAELIHDGIVAITEGGAAGGIFFADPDGTRLEIASAHAGHGHEAPSGAAPTCGFF